MHSNRKVRKLEIAQASRADAPAKACRSERLSPGCSWSCREPLLTRRVGDCSSSANSGKPGPGRPPCEACNIRRVLALLQESGGKTVLQNFRENFLNGKEAKGVAMRTERGMWAGCGFGRLTGASLLLACALTIFGSGTAHGQFGDFWVPIMPVDLSDFKPLQYFQGAHQGDPDNDNGDGVINAYLLAQLSEKIYADALGVDPDWEDDFRNEMIDYGAIDADYYGNTGTGAEVAVVETWDAVIIVHRGSHPNGTPLNLIAADWVHDLNDDVMRLTLGGLRMYLHEGFWRTQDSVHWWVRQRAMQGVANGKHIWVTGHSLGGANATVTAARLHYEEGIPVQGLQTFGSPKVGDVDLQKLFTYTGAGGWKMKDRTHRWAVEGDKATTLFLRDRIVKKYYRFGIPYYKIHSIYYRHVGQTNHIYQSPNGYGFDYEVDYGSPDRSNIMFAPTWSLLPGGAHGMYVPALESELLRRLTEEGRGDDLTDILDG